MRTFEMTRNEKDHFACTVKEVTLMKRNCIWILTSLMLNGVLGIASVSLAEEDTWTTKADMPTGRLWLATSVVDGKIYAIGGRAEGTLATEYEPVTDTWTTKTPMPTARVGLATAVVDGIIYAIGGGTHSARPGGFSVVEAYDPATDTWTRKADMPAPRALLSASVVGGKIYAIGGKPTAADPHPPGVRTVYEYDTGFVPEPSTSVNPAGKLPTLWGEIKRGR